MVLALWMAFSGKFCDGVGRWTLALFFMSLGDILILGRGTVSDYLSIVLANVLLAVSNSLAYAAVCEFIPRRKNNWIFYGPILISALGFVVLLGHPVSTRVLFSGLILGTQNLAVLYLIQRDPNFQEFRIRWLLFIGFLSATLMFSGRALASALSPGFFPTMFASNMFQFYTMSLGFFSIVLISFGFILLSRERTELRDQKTAKALHQSEERFRQLSDATLEGIAIHDENKILDANPALARMFGHDLVEIIGKNALDLAAPEYREIVARNITAGNEEPYEALELRKDHSLFWGELIGKPIPFQGHLARVTAIRDITERKRVEEELKALSLVDDLTGLYNRRGFLTLAEQELKTEQRMGIEMLIIFGDLDNMKAINDTFGHLEGDQALIDTSCILREAFRDSDIVARIGGDEFVILAMNTYETSTEKLINRIEKFMRNHTLQQWRSYEISMSVGAASFDPRNPSPIDVLLTQADKMMYENKHKKPIQNKRVFPF